MVGLSLVDVAEETNEKFEMLLDNLLEGEIEVATEATDVVEMAPCEIPSVKDGELRSLVRGWAYKTSLNEFWLPPPRDRFGDRFGGETSLEMERRGSEGSGLFALVSD